MFLKVLLLLLPLAYGMRIDIDASTEDVTAKVEVSGSDTAVITDRDMSIFKLDGWGLANAVYIFSGRWPTDAYVRSPTPWHDLYKTYNWREIRRTMTPVSARVIGITSVPQIVAEKDFINNSSVKATYNAGISQDVQHTVSHSWSKGGSFDVGASVSVSISFFGASTSMSYSENWGEDHTESETVTLGSSSGVSVELSPGQAVTASLRAQRGYMEIEVEYVATLNGVVACNYDGGFRGHNFWSYDVNAVLQAANLPRVVKSREIIKIGFFANGRIVVKDKLSNMHLVNQAVSILHQKL